MDDFVKRSDVLKLFEEEERYGYIDEQDVLSVPTAQRWIPCSERLPNVNGDYLVTFKYLIFYPVEVCEFKDGRCDSGMYDVVAWSLLPDPYREDGDNDE